MSDLHDFRNTTRFTTGAVGEPGARVFYVQVGDEDSVITLKLEKQQVKALAQFLRTVLDDLPSPQEGLAPVPLLEAEPAWVVGQIAVGVDEADAEVVIVLEELVPNSETGDGEFDLGSQIDDDPTSGWDEPSGARVRAHITVDLAAAFVETSDSLMASGRPPCPLCGQPLDPAGHACPRLN